MAEDFSYESDIAPMQSRFVSGVSGSRALSTRTKQSMIGGYLDRRLAGAQELAKVEDIRDNARLREIQYKNSLASLEEQKRRAEEEKEVSGSLSELTMELNRAIEEPDLEKRRNTLSRIGVAFAPQIAKSPVAEQAYRSASYGANMGSTARPSNTVGDLLRAGATEEDFAGFDTKDPEAPVPSEVMLRFNKRRNEATVNLKMQETKEKADEGRRRALSRTHEEFGKFLDNVTLEQDPLPTVDYYASVLGAKEDKEALNTLKSQIEAEKDVRKKAELQRKALQIGQSIRTKANPLVTPPAASAETKPRLGLFSS